MSVANTSSTHPLDLPIDYTSLKLDEETTDAIFWDISESVKTMSNADRISVAEHAKNLGNDAFKSRQYQLSEFHYSRALLYFPETEENDIEQSIQMTVTDVESDIEGGPMKLKPTSSSTGDNDVNIDVDVNADTDVNGDADINVDARADADTDANVPADANTDADFDGNIAATSDVENSDNSMADEPEDSVSPSSAAKNALIAKTKESLSKAIAKTKSQDTPTPSAFARARAVLYANRSAARLNLEEYASAASDAAKSVEYDNTYVKGYFRLGAAQAALTNFSLAMSAFRAVLRLKPGDVNAKQRLDNLQRFNRHFQFSLAIESEHTAPPSYRIAKELNIMSVPTTYDGPKLDIEKPLTKGRYTVEFINELMQWFKTNHENSRRFPLKYIYAILVDVIEELKALPSLVDVNVPKGTHITVCGDTHGQFYDVFTIFRMNGDPSEKNPYVFNGDFVDRGSFSYELIIMFFLYKLVFPEHFHMTRGNHESSAMNAMYGFKGEVLYKASEQAYDLFTEAFNCLPIACCLGKKVLVLHGGLFEQEGVTLKDIRGIDRFRQPPEQGLMCDALWSDPTFHQGRLPPHRGCGVLFGPDVTAAFCALNDLKYIVRSHEMKAEGYSVDHYGRCITVFSAPNYCDSMGNKGAFLVFDDQLEYKAHVFYHTVHPPVPAMKFVNPLVRG